MKNKCLLKNLLDEDNFGILALIDPDLKNDDKLSKILDIINRNNFLGILVGGSSIKDDFFEKRLSFLKNNTEKPIILFPGSSNQISPHADAILFTSLLSGRNPKYLISEQLKGVESIRKYNLNVIPTGYLLIGSNGRTSVEKISETTPLNPLDFNNILNHALVAQYFGMRYIYLECGSGAKENINPKLVSYLKKHIDISIIVGGGITNKNQIQNLKKAGASFVVIGTLLEKVNYDSVFSLFD
jgi:phosphoglycerol geranylgeranyltransferase|tara:strand:+ start:1043 stop:1768 length:726 start_codon:yes stop_codon:yes gene_type:complete